MIDFSQYHFYYEALKLHFLLKISLASFLGGLVGLERGRRKKPAGLRTHILVALGSCMFIEMSLLLPQIYPEAPAMDPSRILAQMIVGISFIGAGTVIRTGDKIAGLTTAAAIWVTASIGAAVAANLFLEAIGMTIFTFFVLYELRSIERKAN